MYTLVSLSISVCIYIHVCWITFPSTNYLCGLLGAQSFFRRCLRSIQIFEARTTSLMVGWLHRICKASQAWPGDVH